jgi:hypothetical protein
MAQLADFVPGVDQEADDFGSPSSAAKARGVFANILQGSTPKYAINSGRRDGRPDLFRNTMARMFVRIDPNELPLFKASVTDLHTKDNLVSRLVGDPTSASPEAVRAAPQAAAARRALRSSAATNGYLDFLIQNVQMSHQEKLQVSETLADNYVAYAFGQAPPVWNFAGSLINSVQDDQASNMFRIYTEILRATQLARRQKSLSLSFDSYVVNGVMMNMTMSLNAANELVVPFSFQLLVKRVFFTNFTSGWTPTTAGTPFPADPLAHDFDRIPREEGMLLVPHVTTPPATMEVAPVPGAAPNANAATPVINGVAGVGPNETAQQAQIAPVAVQSTARPGDSPAVAEAEAELARAGTILVAADAADNAATTALTTYIEDHPNPSGMRDVNYPHDPYGVLETAVLGVTNMGQREGGTQQAAARATANYQAASQRVDSLRAQGAQAASTPPAPAQTPTPPVL